MTEQSGDIGQYIQELKETSQTIKHRLGVLEGNRDTCICECHAVIEQKEIKALEAKLIELDEREKRRHVEIDTIKHDMGRLEAALSDLCKSEKSNAVQLKPKQGQRKTASNQGDILGKEFEFPKPTANDTSIVKKANEPGYSGSDYIKPTAESMVLSEDHSQAQKEDRYVRKAKSRDVQNNTQDDDTSNVLDAKDSTALQHRKVAYPNFKRKPDVQKKERKYRKPSVQHEETRHYRSAEKWWELCKLEEHEGEATDVKYLEGVHTILCVDISESMVDAWLQVQTFVHDYLDGLDKLVSEESFSEENVALVTFGHETKVQVRSTKELSKIRNAFESITLGGPTPMFGGVLMAVCAAQSNSKTCHVKGAEIHKRIVLISDCHSTQVELFSGPDVTDKSKTDENVARLLDILERFPQSGKELICVPVGDANTDLVDTMQTIACGRRFSYTEGTKLARRFYLTTKSPIGLASFGGLPGTGGLLGGLGGLSLPGMDLSGMEGLSSLTSDLQAHLQAQVAQLHELHGLSGMPSLSTSTDTTGLSKEDQDHIKEIVEDHKELTVESIKRKMTGHSEKQYVESNSTTLPKIGSRVRRGPDWTWRNQDGEGPGTVIGHDEKDGQVWIHWDADDQTNIYHYGGSMRYDVLLVDEPRLVGANNKLKVGCVVTPGDKWKFDFRRVQRNEEGVVIRISTTTKNVQVKWTNGYRGDYSYSPKGSSELKIAKCSLSNPAEATGSAKVKRSNKNKNVFR